MRLLAALLATAGATAGCGGGTPRDATSRAARRVVVPPPDELEAKPDGEVLEGRYVGRDGAIDLSFCTAACRFALRPGERIVECGPVEPAGRLGERFGVNYGSIVICVFE